MGFFFVIAYQNFTRCGRMCNISGLKKTGSHLSVVHKIAQMLGKFSIPHTCQIQIVNSAHQLWHVIVHHLTDDQNNLASTWQVGMENPSLPHYIKPGLLQRTNINDNTEPCVKDFIL